jgi:hypothetical protein
MTPGRASETGAAASGSTLAAAPSAAPVSSRAIAGRSRPTSPLVMQSLAPSPRIADATSSGMRPEYTMNGMSRPVDWSTVSAARELKPGIA